MRAWTVDADDIHVAEETPAIANIVSPSRFTR
jgi:hypothetical protein